MKTYNAEVYGYLFGSVLSVTPEELRIIGALSVLVLSLLLLFAKELYFIAFDQEMAEASGVPARQMFFLLLTLVALTVVVSLKTVGAILVFAMILIPASTAYQLTHSLRTLTLYSAALLAGYEIDETRKYANLPTFQQVCLKIRRENGLTGIKGETSPKPNTPNVPKTTKQANRFEAYIDLIDVLPAELKQTIRKAVKTLLFANDLDETINNVVSGFNVPSKSDT
jgi:hypothetical protein